MFIIKRRAEYVIVEIVVVSLLDRGKHLYHDIIFVIHQIAIYFVILVTIVHT